MSQLSAFFIYNSSLDLKNGSNTHILELTSNLLGEVDLLLFAPANSCQKLPHYIVPIKVIGNDKVSSLIYQASYQVGLFFKLLYYCLIKKPNIIYERACGWSILPAFIAKILKIPYIVEVNGLFLDELKSGHFPGIYLKICSFNEKRNYNLAKKVIVVTKGIKEEIINLYSILDDKIIVVNNGANVDLFCPVSQIEAKNKLKLDPSKIYLCFVGNCAPWQGVEYLIKASPLVLKKKSNTGFLIVGDGVMKNQWMKLVDELEVSNNFYFIGSIPYELVPIYINASDICVVPKKPIKSGYSPLKLYEYMACGKPIIATNTDGFELLEESNAGILIDPENSTEFANSIIMLLNNPKLMSHMGENGRRYVVEKHTWDNIAKQIINICNDVVKSNY